jgi:non-canonical (house-cleaning) NTP pyrophosphatase
VHKVNAVQKASESMFDEHIIEVVACDVGSGVSIQPEGFGEISQGAFQRATEAKEQTRAAIGIGLEAGIVQVNNRLLDIGIVYALGQGGVTGIASTVGIELPEDVASIVHSGLEVRQALMAIYSIEKESIVDCASILTAGRLTTTQYYQPAVELVLTRILQITEP